MYFLKLLSSSKFSLFAVFDKHMKIRLFKTKLLFLLRLLKSI